MKESAKKKIVVKKYPKSLNENKRKFLAFLQRNSYTITDTCRDAGISKVTFYAWMKYDPIFRECYENERQSILDLAEKVIVKALLDGDKDMSKFVATKLSKKGDWTNNQLDITQIGTGGFQLNFFNVQSQEDIQKFKELDVKKEDIIDDSNELVDMEIEIIEDVKPIIEKGENIDDLSDDLSNWLNETT
jgi:hypothetical protein